MKVRRFVDGLNSHLTPLVHMKNPQDLEEAFEAASRAATGFDLGKKADAEASLAEQVEALQIQLAEMTTGSRLPINCAMPVQVYQLPQFKQGQVEHRPSTFHPSNTNSVPAPNSFTNPFVNYQQPYH